MTAQAAVHRTGSAAFVRTAPAPALAPPALSVGWLGWLRANLFATPFNAVLTVLTLLLLAWTVPPVVRFLLIDAVWSGADREACLVSAQHPHVGACWAFVRDRLGLFHLRLLSDFRALAGRRVLRDDGFRHRLAVVARRAAPRPRGLLFLRRAAGDVVLPAVWVSAARASDRDTSRWAASWSPSWWRASASWSRSRSASCWRSGGRSRMPAVKFLSVGFIEIVRACR